MDFREEVTINRLEQAYNKLNEALVYIIEINKEKQFDYVSNSELGAVVNNVEYTLRKINKIVFQK